MNFEVRLFGNSAYDFHDADIEKRQRGVSCPTP